MRPDEYESLPVHDSRGSRFELFFYERVGSRYYLRFTRLALILVVCLTVIPCVAILALYYKESRAAPEDFNVSVRPRPPANYGTIVMPPPPAMPSPPRVGRSPRGSDPARQASAAPGVNANAPPTPSPTPSPTPARPPS